VYWAGCIGHGQHIKEGIIRDGLLRLITSSGGHEEIAVTDGKRCLLGQSSFAGSGLARQNNHPSLSSYHGVHDRQNPTKFLVPSHERFRWQSAKEASNGKLLDLQMT
jgi:hypothetical protein